MSSPAEKYSEIVTQVTEALKNGSCLEIDYGGFSRTVEVHAVGLTTSGNPCMRVWQVRGGSLTDVVGWKMLKLEKVENITVLAEKSLAPREGYQKGDRGMIKIISEL